MMQERIAAGYLIIHQGPGAPKRLELWKDITTIGRSRDCDIFLEDISVHRKQASILFSSIGYVLRDDHGSGDSFVNGKSVQEQLLKDGDKLLFGNTELTFYSREGTRPFQLPSSRGRELLKGKQPDPNTGTIALLQVTSQQGGARTFELLPEMTIGRSRDCAIFLEDLAVSRIHATIHQLPDNSYEVEDNRSATGTFVNGQAVTRCRLKEGDVVQIGANRLIFRLSR